MIILFLQNVKVEGMAHKDILMPFFNKWCINDKWFLKEIHTLTSISNVHTLEKVMKKIVNLDHYFTGFLLIILVVFAGERRAGSFWSVIICYQIISINYYWIMWVKIVTWGKWSAFLFKSSTVCGVSKSILLNTILRNCGACGLILLSKSWKNIWMNLVQKWTSDYTEFLNLDKIHFCRKRLFY